MPYGTGHGPLRSPSRACRCRKPTTAAELRRLDRAPRRALRLLTALPPARRDIADAYGGPARAGGMPAAFMVLLRPVRTGGFRLTRDRPGPQGCRGQGPGPKVPPTGLGESGRAFGGGPAWARLAPEDGRTSPELRPEVLARGEAAPSPAPFPAARRPAPHPACLVHGGPGASSALRDRVDHEPGRTEVVPRSGEAVLVG
ncbi:hypothetical protein GCM10010275_43410 [Streptomyces litmocidini]|nr:hypothetical protein GCM10010275_43410 [Streptomyces litmocidini]